MIAVALASAWTLVLIYLLSAPVPDVEPLFRGVDKAVHFGLFFVWGGLWVWAQGGLRGWILAAGLALAIATEWVQAALLPHRTGDLQDAAVDLAGAVVGAFAVAWILARATKKNAA